MEDPSFFRWLIGAVVVAAFGTMLWLATRPPPLTVQGEVSADRVDISPRVAGAGRHAEVRTSATPSSAARCMAELESPQLGRGAARRPGGAGASRRPISIGSTASVPRRSPRGKADLDAAKADETLNQETYDRQIELARTGNAPQARVDEATRNLRVGHP